MKEIFDEDSIQLHPSETFLFGLDHLSEPILIINSKDMILHVNSAFRDVLKYKYDDVIGKQLKRFVHENDYQKIRLNSKNMEKRKIRFKANTGLFIWFEVAVASLSLNDNSAINHLILKQEGSFEDSDLSTDTLEKAVFKSIPDFFFIMNREGRYLDYRGTNELLYASPEEFLNRTCTEIMPEDNAKKTIEAIETTLDSKQSTSFEYKLPLKSGDTYFEARFLYLNKESVGVFVRDISKQKETKLELQRKIAVETLIAQISTNFISLSPEKIDQTIQEALKTIGEFTGVDRSYVFLFSEDRKTISNTHEWCASGIDPQIENLQDEEISRFPWWLAQLEANKTIAIQKLEDLPQASREQQVLAEQDILSIIVVPIVIDNEPLGFVGLDSVKQPMSWSDEVRLLLRICAEIFGKSLLYCRNRQKLRESEHRYHTLFNGWQEIILVSSVNDDMRFGNIIECNESAKKILGYTDEEFEEMKISDLLRNGDSEEARFPCDPSGNQMSLESVIVTKSGESFPVRLSSQCFTVNGRRMSFTFISDITERLTFEELLSKSEKKYRTIVELSPSLIMLIDDHGEIIEANPSAEKALNLTAEKMVGSNIEDLYIMDRPHVDRLLSLIEDSKTQQNIQKTEFSFVNNMGKSFHLKTYISPVELDGKLITQIIGHDITQRVRAERQLRDSKRQVEAVNKELEAFTFSISHDLQAPLRRISAFSQAILEDFGDSLPEGSEQYFQMLIDNATLMKDRVDGLYNLAKLSKSEIAREKVAMSGLVFNVYENLKDDYPETEYDFIVQEDVNAEADPNLIRVVLQNLIDNALKFTQMEENPRVEFGIRTERRKDIYYIKDNGIGFKIDKDDPAQKNRLFGLFQRLTNDSRVKGTGIGLATCKRIIHRHGGRIWAESVPGEGSTFYFTVE